MKRIKMMPNPKVKKVGPIQQQTLLLKPYGLKSNTKKSKKGW